MLGRILDRLRSARPEPLSGAPQIRRRKTYSAQSGYVYQYVYQGYRKRAHDTEYVFDVSSDRKASFPVPVVLPDDAVGEWECAHDFTLRENERHGIVKLALFQAFDERPSPGDMRAEVLVRRADLDAIIDTLGIL
jgi:hypothetical protein